jgi:NADP-dependent 3-hydroxy acid dehydrogenase YdfG
LIRRIASAGGDAIAKPIDVRRGEDLRAFVAAAQQRYDRLDVLVNNAGVMPVSPLDALRVDDWELMDDVNVKGVLYGIAAALPVFRRQGFGHLINTASTAAFRVVRSQSVYAGTKMAVRTSDCRILNRYAGRVFSTSSRIQRSCGRQELASHE